MPQTQSGLSERQLNELNEAHSLYKALKESADKPTLFVVLIEAAAKKALDMLAGYSVEGVVGTRTADLLKEIFSSKHKDRDKIRKAADSLTLSALGVSEENLPLN